MRNKTITQYAIYAMGIISLAFFLLSCQQTKTVLTIENGSGLPGSENNRVEITLDNPLDKVKGIQADICDAGNYLVGVNCEPTGAASELNCVFNEMSNGCFRVVLFSASAALIEEGTGSSVLSISYNVSENAPAGQCVDLIPQQVLISNEDNDPLTPETAKGTFCF